MTIPVYKMGQMFLYDAVQAANHQRDFDLLSLDDIDNTFDHVTQLKYSQRHFISSGSSRYHAQKKKKKKKSSS